MLAQHIRAVARWGQFASILAVSGTAHAELCSVREPVCIEGAASLVSLHEAERAYATLRVLGLPEPVVPLGRATLPVHVEAAPGCTRETGIVRAVLRASLAGVHAEVRTEAALLSAFTELASPCNPPDAPPPSAGWPLQGARFLSWLDAKVGAAGPGRYLAGVATKLPYRDLFAVLRENTKDAFFSGSTFADAAAAYGLAQFVPPREPPAWDLEWPVTPRALLLPVPLAPLASTSIRLREPHGDLRIEAAWEQHAAFRIAVLALDEGGAVISRAWVPTRPRVNEASFTFDEVPSARAVLLVLTSVGDPFEPLSADQASFEPHGAVVTLAGR